MRVLLQITLSLLFTVSAAQEKSTIPQVLQVADDGCTDELVKSAEKSFNERLFARQPVAQRRLQEVAWLCQERAPGFRAKELLRVVDEEMADHELAIARYYLLKKLPSGKGGLLGGLYRLEGILKRYPTYSKLDETLSLLVQAHALKGNAETANGYFQRLITEYPSSPYIGQAAIQLNSYDVLKAQSSKPVP